MTEPGGIRATIELPASALRIEAPRPIMLSQHTSEAVLGLKRRAFIELVRDFRASGGEVINAGRTRLVELEPFVAWLRHREITAQSEDGAEAMAREMGLCLVERGGA